MDYKPTRKINRLENYDYSQNGAYFITICTKDHSALFGKIIVGANCVRLELSEIGLTVDSEIPRLPDIYEGIVVSSHVVMPNHIHMIIEIENTGRTKFAPTISRIIKQFKGAITKLIGFSPWQKSFHDHVIRNQEDYNRIAEYIDNNPAKWAEDRYYTG